MKITIVNKAEGFRLTLEQVRSLYRVAKTTLATEHDKRPAGSIPGAMEISLTLVDDEEIARINEEFRGLAKPTDVLSFPMFEAAEPLHPGSSLGDLVISVDTMRRQAEEYGHSLRREMCFLFVHGLLHLLGYDHEISEAEEFLQFGRQEEILTELGITR